MNVVDQEKEMTLLSSQQQEKYVIKLRVIINMLLIKQQNEILDDVIVSISS